MHWIEKNVDIRFNPQLLLENSKTAIVVLQGHKNAGRNKTDENAACGKIARSMAQEEDYHVSMKRKLKELSEKILDAVPEAKFRPCVDTAPILEKYWAQEAGLGVIGKNTVFISDKIGSFCNIGILLTDINLAQSPKSPHKNFCENCEKCMKSCPTKALVSPYTLDCNKCISYQSQKKTNPNFDCLGWELGCDICQEVCPRNGAL